MSSPQLKKNSSMKMKSKLSFRGAVKKVGMMRSVTKEMTEAVAAGSADGAVVPPDVMPLVDRARELSQDSTRLDQSFETFTTAVLKMEEQFGHPYAIAAAKISLECAELASKAKNWEVAVASFDRAREGFEISGSGVADGQKLFQIVKASAHAYFSVTSLPKFKEEEYREERRDLAVRGVRLARRSMNTMSASATEGEGERVLLNPLAAFAQLASQAGRPDLAIRSIERNMAIKKRLKLGMGNVEGVRDQLLQKINALSKEEKQAQVLGWEREDFEEDEWQLRNKVSMEQERGRIAIIVLFRGIIKLREIAESGANAMSAGETFRLMVRIAGAATKAKMPTEAHHFYSEACDLLDEAGTDDIGISFDEKRSARASLGFSLCTLAQNDHAKGSELYRQLMSAAAPHYDRAMEMTEEYNHRKRAAGTLVAADELSHCNLMLQLGVIAANLEFNDYGLLMFKRVKTLHEKHNASTATEDKYISVMERAVGRRKVQMLEEAAKKREADRADTLAPEDATLSGARALISDGQANLNEKDFATAEKSLHLSLAIMDQIARHEPEVRTSLEYRTALSTLGAVNYQWALTEDGRTPEFRRRNELAVSYYRHSLSILQEEHGTDDHPACTSTHFNLGCVFYNLELSLSWCSSSSEGALLFSSRAVQESSGSYPCSGKIGNIGAPSLEPALPGRVLISSGVSV